MWWTLITFVSENQSKNRAQNLFILDTVGIGLFNIIDCRPRSSVVAILDSKTWTLRHRIGNSTRSLTSAKFCTSAISQSARVIADANLRHSSPSWQVQPVLCTYQNLIKTSGWTSQDGVNWRQQVKIFADKNIKGSDKSETSGTTSYSVITSSDQTFDLIHFSCRMTVVNIVN